MERALLRGSLRLGGCCSCGTVASSRLRRALLLLLGVAAELHLRVALRDLRVDLLLQLLLRIGEVFRLELLHLTRLPDAAVREDDGKVAHDLAAVKLVRAERRRAR